jgi:hypothetical protein
MPALVLAYSRRLFVQYSPRFTRFEAKYFHAGTGSRAMMAGDMAAFAARGRVQQRHCV